MRLACMFPGQGSQSMGMLRSVYDHQQLVRDVFNQALEVLGVDYWHMILEGPEQHLNDTINTQVVMLIADYAMYRLLRSLGMPKPQIMAGHSLGEYAALVAANAIDFADALKLVRKRALCMQVAMREQRGAMAAIIGLEQAQVQDICKQLMLESLSGAVIEPANYNAPGQIVVAGHHEMIESSLCKFEAAGAKLCKILPVSIPCHCRLMLPAAEEFRAELLQTSMQVPDCDVISNVDLSVYSSVDDMKTLLAQQLYRPVRWTETLGYFQEQGIDILVECGPAKVLCGLAKRTVPNLQFIYCYEHEHLPNWEQV